MRVGEVPKCPATTQHYEVMGGWQVGREERREEGKGRPARERRREETE